MECASKIWKDLVQWLGKDETDHYSPALKAGLKRDREKYFPVYTGDSSFCGNENLRTER